MSNSPSQSEETEIQASTRKGEVVRLGTVSAPSGILLVIDMGYLDLWSHDREPVFPEAAGSEETVASANSAIDFEIVGADAEEAGTLFDSQWHPTFVYDIPANACAGFKDRFVELVAENQLDAKLRALDHRVTHRRRVDLAITHGHGAGEVQFHGIWACAIGGVPSDRELPVLAERMTSEPHTARWRRVCVECQTGVAVERSEEVGYVAVDWARLMFADVDSLAEWEHNESLDGKADFVFWGTDAAEVAEVVDAPSQQEGQFGWLDQPVGDVVRLGNDVDRIRDERGLKLSTDFRPHSHHHEVMRCVRASATESAVIDLGRAKVCGFMSSWGDGIFVVYRDLAADSSLVRIRVELGTPERVELMRKVTILSKYALVTKRITEDGEPIRFLFREKSDRAEDSGWRLFAGDESDEYLNDPANTTIDTLGRLCERDKNLEPVFFSAIGAAYERADADGEFHVVDDFVSRDE